MDQIAVTNKAFVLSRAVINIIEMPSLDEVIQITTYPAGIEKLYFVRDYEMFCNGRLFASARTLWLVIDIDTRRPDRNLAKSVDFPLNTNLDLGLTNPVKPRLPEATEPIYSTLVRYSDIDILGHANNSSYVRWAGDCLGEDFFKNNESYSITLNFSSEMKEGDELSVFSDGSLFMGKSSGDRETFRVMVETK
jgi:acyl-ACP thioesterase